MNESRPPMRGPRRAPRNRPHAPPPPPSRLDQVQEGLARSDRSIDDLGADRRERKAFNEDLELLRSARHMPRERRMALLRAQRQRRFVIHLMILVAAILLVVVPIVMNVVHRHHDLDQRSRWSEARANAGLINSALRVLRAEGEPYAGSGEIRWVDLDLAASEFDGMHFAASDYRVFAAGDGTWEITVRSSKTDGPTGQLSIDQSGRERFVPD